MDRNQTIEYYNQNAREFADDTVSVDLHDIQDQFLEYLKPGSHILDFGCGIGRDTKYFLDHGFEVTAIDGSGEMSALASEFTGIPVRTMLFQNLNDIEAYDGIWACASILHLPKAELTDVLQRLSRALRNDGVIYTSFKHGDFEGERNGRYFTDMTEGAFDELLRSVDRLEMEKTWTTSDARPGRVEEKWLNLILRKIN